MDIMGERSGWPTPWYGTVGYWGSGYRSRKGEERRRLFETEDDKRKW